MKYIVIVNDNGIERALRFNDRQFMLDVCNATELPCEVYSSNDGVNYTRES